MYVDERKRYKEKVREREGTKNVTSPNKEVRDKKKKWGRKKKKQIYIFMITLGTFSKHFLFDSYFIFAGLIISYQIWGS